MRVVEEVRAQVEGVPEERARRVARGRDRDALICRDAGPGELADQPAIRELVVEDHRVAIAVGLAHAAEPTPDRRDADRAEHRCPGRLVPDLVAVVDDLDELRRAGLAIRIGRGTEAGDAGERDPVEVLARGGHRRRGGSRLDDRVSGVRERPTGLP